MRCIKTRKLLALLIAAWLVGVVYFLSGMKSLQVLSTHDNDDLLDEYDRLLNEEESRQRSTEATVKVYSFAICS